MTPTQLKLANKSYTAIREIDDTIASLEAAMAQMATTYTKQSIVIKILDVDKQQAANNANEIRNEKGEDLINESHGIPKDLRESDAYGNLPVIKVRWNDVPPVDLTKTLDIDLSPREMISTLRVLVTIYQGRKEYHIHHLRRLGIKI